MKQIKNLVLEEAVFYDAPMNELKLNLFTSQLANCEPKQLLDAMLFFRSQPGRRQMPMPADLIDRISQCDGGHPGVEEAWAMIPKNETDSCVWTDEIANIFAIVNPLLQEDPIAARMTFKEMYSSSLAQARVQNRPATWTASLGFDKTSRTAALHDAVQKKRITLDYAKQVFPELESQPGPKQLLDTNSKRLIDPKSLLQNMPTENNS